MTNAAEAVPPREKLEPAACVGAGWRAFMRRPALGLALLMAVALVSLIDLIPWAGDVLSFLFGPVLAGGAALLAMRMVEDRQPRFGHLLAGFGRAVPLVITQCLYLLMLLGVLAPVILPIVLAGEFADPATLLFAVMSSVLLIPLMPVAIFLALRFAFLTYLLMDSRRVGVLDAFARSWTMTRGVFWRLFGLLLLTGVLQLAGMLALLVGLFVTLPMAMLAWSEAYARLRPADLAPPAAAPAPAEPLPFSGVPLVPAPAAPSIEPTTLPAAPAVGPTTVPAAEPPSSARAECW